MIKISTLDSSSTLGYTLYSRLQLQKKECILFKILSEEGWQATSPTTRYLLACTGYSTACISSPFLKSHINSSSVLCFIEEDFFIRVSVSPRRVRWGGGGVDCSQWRASCCESQDFSEKHSFIRCSDGSMTFHTSKILWIASLDPIL